MIHPRRLAVTGLLALSLTGCGAGLDAYTYQERPQAENTNVNLGTLAVRNITILPPSEGRTYEAGGEARGIFRVANGANSGDVLLEVTSSDADEVVLLDEGRPSELEIPARGSTEERGSFLLRGLTDPLVTGEYVTLTFRFERNGTIEALVPVTTNGRAGRPVYTREEGSEEGEPALQGPAGGHGPESEEEAKGGEQGGSEAQIGTGEEGAAEGGEVEDVGDTAPPPTQPPAEVVVEPSTEPTPEG